MTSGIQRLGTRAARNLFAACIILVLLASFCSFIFRNYYIKAYSDPLNWLKLADNLREGFSTARFPAGYPIFLRVALATTGPFYVFLSNLPVLILVVVLLCALSVVVTRETESPTLSLSAGLVSMALLLRFDTYALVYMTNPYRDPLSHVLMLVAALLFIRYLRTGGNCVWVLPVSGFVLGLSFFVKEPSILMAGPLFLAGLVFLRSSERITFWKASLLFGGAFALGCIPSLVQTYLVTGQLLEPVYSRAEGRLLPGINPRAVGTTTCRALQYYWERGGALAVVGLILGLFFAVRRKNRLLLSLVVPAVITFAVFYAFFWVFAFRYFFIVTVLAMPILAFGFCKLAETIARIVRKPGLATALLALLVVGTTASTVWSLRPKDTDGGGFRIEHAVQIKADIETLAPPGATVFAHRHVYEIIEFFTHCDSYPSTYLLQAGFVSDQPVFASVVDMISAGNPPYYVSAPYDNDGNIGYDLLRRHFDLNFIAALPTAKYNLQEMHGDGPFLVYQIAMPTNSLVNIELAGVSGIREPLLTINAPMLWHPGSEREKAELRLNGRLLDERVDNGMNYYPLKISDIDQTGLLELISDAPIPRRLEAVVLEADDVVTLDFGVLSAKNHDHLLSGPAENQPVWNAYARAIRAKSSVQLPVTCRDIEQLVFVDLYLKIVKRLETEAPVRFSVWTPGSDQPSTSFLPRTNVFQKLSVQYPSLGKDEFETIQLEAGSSLPQGIELVDRDDLELVEIDRIEVTRVRVGNVLEIDIGTPSDTAFVSTGFHGRETCEAGTVRWTDGAAGLALYIRKPESGNAVIEVTYLPGYTPESAPAADVKLVFNDVALETRERVVDDKGIVAAILPRTLISDDWTVPGTLKILSTPWKPSECLGSADPRTLGIMVDRVRVFPE
jgi:hypothetical protein